MLQRLSSDRHHEVLSHIPKVVWLNSVVFLVHLPKVMRYFSVELVTSLNPVVTKVISVDTVLNHLQGNIAGTDLVGLHGINNTSM